MSEYERGYQQAMKDVEAMGVRFRVGGPPYVDEVAYRLWLNDYRISVPEVSIGTPIQVSEE